MKTYLDIITDGLYIGEPYINLSTNEIMYYDRRILNRIIASNGMAAGNTLEEALNQGISELAERLVTKWFFEKEQKQYYLITHDSINSSIIKTIINNIEERGNKVYIFDLSYNFNLPVIMTLIIN
jgi:ribosomal protein S12 methylthiotransferase accessory factor